MKIGTAHFHRSVKLTNSDLKEEVFLNCPICGSDKKNLVCYLQTEPEIDLLDCQHCHATYVSRFPTEKTLDKYYANYYDSDFFEKFNAKVTIDNPLKFATHLYKNISHHISISKKKLRVLDFGGGDGTTSRLLSLLFTRNGFSIDLEVVDYDISSNLQIYPDGSRVIFFDQNIDLTKQEQYDIIIASAVLEHIPNLNKTLAILLSCLSDSGIIYVRTPYIVPLLKILKLVGIKWDFTFPAHLYDLGQLFWENYFGSLASFKLLASQPSIVETSISKHPIKTILSLIMKAPWHIFKRYNLVGGWEVFAQKTLKGKLK